MIAASTIQSWQIDQLRRSLDIYRFVIDQASHEDLRHYRDGGAGWTVLEILCHMRDLEAIYFERARATIEQDKPGFSLPDVDQLAVDSRYNEQDIEVVFADWSKTRHAYLDYLKGLNEEGWMRTGIHNRRGPMTLQDQVILTVWHDNNHLEQAARILREKKSSAQ